MVRNSTRVNIWYFDSDLVALGMITDDDLSEVAAGVDHTCFSGNQTVSEFEFVAVWMGERKK